MKIFGNNISFKNNANYYEGDIELAKDIILNIFENSHTIMLIIDPMTGYILDANKTACEYYGYLRSELIQKTIYDINMFTKEQISQEMEKAKSEERHYFLFKHRLFSGEARDVEVYSGPIHYKGKKFLYSIIHDVTYRLQVEREKEELIKKLEKALEEIKTLKGILPVCSSCKKIRDDKGYWTQLEDYLSKHSQAEFSHGMCPECLKKLYPDFFGE